MPRIAIICFLLHLNRDLWDILQIIMNQRTLFILLRFPFYNPTMAFSQVKHSIKLLKLKNDFFIFEILGPDHETMNYIRKVQGKKM